MGSALEWEKCKKVIIKNGLESGKLRKDGGVLIGQCVDCGAWKPITLDHRLKRSLGGTHEPTNIDFVCFRCHQERDNMGDPKGKKEHKVKKPEWAKKHKCKICKKETDFLLCNHCGNVSL